MKTSVLLAVVLVVAVVVVGYALVSIPKNTAAPVTSLSAPTASSTPDSSASSTPAASGYTMADVAMHNTAQSCWTAINGKVYDVTTWISEHPGGPQHIIPLCGTDGTAAFEGQHQGQGAPQAELATFYIGDLTQ